MADGVKPHVRKTGLEAQVALTRLVRRFPGLAFEAVEWNGRINLRGPATLTVRA